jgi:dTDP-4-amino-4,6-dideoxygalactose transaminase
MSDARTPQLAIFGRTPAFTEPLHVGRPNIGDKAAILARIGDILERRWLTNDGPCVRELEQRIAERVGVKHCICVCNGTVGLELLVRALGLEGEVIVPSFTFVATAHAVRWLGHTPVFADINPATHSLDVDHVERLITRQTSAILGVHLWGIPCAIDELTALARRHGLRLIFDAAHAFGCSYQGRPIGGHGDAEVYSFHATKFFNTFEGGAIVTNDERLAQECQKLRNFGFEGFDNVTRVGTNGKMPEVCAAMGLESLRSLDQFVARNRSNWQAYAKQLEGIAGLSLLQYPSDTSNYQYVVVTVTPSASGLTRDELVAVLEAENVLARRYFAPGTHRMKAYRGDYAHVTLPVTENLAERILCLPTGTAVSEADIERICEVLRLAVACAGQVRSRLESVK